MSDEKPEAASEGGIGQSASTAGLERTRFEKLCAMLPADVNWFDPITPEIVREIIAAAQNREREDCAKALPDVLFDGYAVMHALDKRQQARTSQENVSDVLDAVVRLMRSNVKVSGPEAALSPEGRARP